MQACGQLVFDSLSCNGLLAISSHIERLEVADKLKVPGHSQIGRLIGGKRKKRVISPVMCSQQCDLSRQEKKLKREIGHP